MKENAYNLAMRVDANKQLKPTQFVRFFGENRDGLRVMFVGNSITLHGIRPEIGWHHSWGMAASAEEKDYVHLCAHHICKQEPGTQFCICQVAAWEMQYARGEELLKQFEAAREFAADAIIVKLCANCPTEGFDEKVFLYQLDKLMEYINPLESSRILMATEFYHHPAENAIRTYAKQHAYDVCMLSDLSDCEEMKAIGQYEHAGICNHPGDLGMHAIAERICNVWDRMWNINV